MYHYGARTIVAKSSGADGYALRIEDDRLVLRLHIDYPVYGEVVIAGSTYIPTYAWTHVAACRAADRVQLFVNGVPDACGWAILPAWSYLTSSW
jgi:hypothetical protein